MRYKPLSASISQLLDSSSYDTGRRTCVGEAGGRCKGLHKAWPDQPAEPGSAELSTPIYSVDWTETVYTIEPNKDERKLKFPN